MITIKYYGIEGTGKNVTEAKRDAGSRIEKMLGGDYTPFLIRHGGYVALLTREPAYGWGYRLINDDEQGFIHCGSHVNNCGDPRKDFEEIRLHAYRHLAQLAGHYTGLVLPDATKRELDRYYDWQDAYREVRDAGGTDEQARESASRSQWGRL
jgi:hypothetical protein